MRTLRLLAVYLLAVIALAMSASAAASKPALVLKEEHVPVPVGAEVTMDLIGPPSHGCVKYRGTEVEFLPWAFHGHMAVNEARTDVITFNAEKSECDGLGLYPGFGYGRLEGMSLAVYGQGVKAKAQASLVVGSAAHAGFADCEYDINAFGGKVPVPGYARIEGAGRGTLDPASHNGEHGEKCRKRRRLAYPENALYGPNGKLLETELIG